MYYDYCIAYRCFIISSAFGANKRVHKEYFVVFLFVQINQDEFKAARLRIEEQHKSVEIHLKQVKVLERDKRELEEEIERLRSIEKTRDSGMKVSCETMLQTWAPIFEKIL